MLITRKSDYALRILRVLQDQRVHNVREICQREEIPRAFAYKILRELEQADLVGSERGNQGGYLLNTTLDQLTLYDVVRLTEGDMAILQCMKEDCSRNTKDAPCSVHQEMARIQILLVRELKKKPLSQVIGGEEPLN